MKYSYLCLYVFLYLYLCMFLNLSFHQVFPGMMCNRCNQVLFIFVFVFVCICMYIVHVSEFEFSPSFHRNDVQSVQSSPLLSS